MLTRLLDEHDVRCEFCNDEPALFRFGQYGKGIGERCIEAFKTISRENTDEEVCTEGHEENADGSSEEDGEGHAQEDGQEGLLGLGAEG